jgi:hypothetical protein
MKRNEQEKKCAVLHGAYYYGSFSGLLRDDRVILKFPGRPKTTKDRLQHGESVAIDLVV